MAMVLAARSATARAALLGFAGGLRSTLPAAAVAVDKGRRARGAAVVAVAGELVADKLPVTPSRLKPGSLAVRLSASAAASGYSARQRRLSGRAVAGSALVGVAAAALGSIAGSRWRQWAAPRFGSDWPAAVLEDALGIGLLGYLVATDASR